MNNIIKKVPLPMAGLMLGLGATGNLIMSYGSNYRNIFGILSAMVMFLLIIKAVSMPKSIREGFENPVVATVMPTFSMGIMILSTYLKAYSSSFALGMWFFGLALHCIFIIIVTKKYILNFNIKKVFPSYFIVYVGIVAGSVTAPIFNLFSLGQYIFWFGFITYLILLPIVIYRVLVVKEMPEPTIPTITIFSAPASLCLAGYLNSFQEKNVFIVGFLVALSLIMFISVMTYIPKMLRLKFYPSYSAFTFPFVITAIAMKGTNAFLLKSGTSIPYFKGFVNLLELWTVAIVLYVLVRYIMFITSAEKVSTPAVANQR